MLELSQNFLLSAIVFLPTVGALGLLVLHRDEQVWTRRYALVTALAVFGLSLMMLAGFNAAEEGYQFEELAGWMERPAINYHFGVDGLSVFLVLLTTFLTPIAMLTAWKSVKKRVREFYLLLLVLETGMLGVFLSLDLFLFFLFWEVSLIPMVFLIGVWGHERRIYAAVKFVLFTMAGSILMLVAILWLYNLTGTFDLQLIQVALKSGQVALQPTTELLLFLAFFVAFAIKVPLVPFHTWLPDAHVEAPTAGSVILAGVLLKLGTYGMLRYCLPLFPDASHVAAPYVAALAIVGIIYGALVAMVQPNLKKLIAYSSVSHMGFIVLGIFTFGLVGIQGANYQMLNHGVSTGALFILAGMLYDRRHTYSIADYGGLATPMPVFSAFFLFVCLSSMGLPMLNGFVGEYLVLLGTWAKSHAWGALATTGVILSAVYLLWMYQRVIYGPVTHAENSGLPDVSAREKVILGVLAMVILYMGIGSVMFTSRMEVSSQKVLEQMERNKAYLATEELKKTEPAAPSAIAPAALPPGEAIGKGGTQ